MAERDRLEGWGVRAGWGFALAAGFFGVLVASVAALDLFYRAQAGSVRAPSPSAFPAPRLVVAQRSPRPLAAPSRMRTPPDEAAWRARLETAMRTLAAEGGRAWGPDSGGAP